MEILILAALILLNGAFAMSEIALVAARRARLTRLAEEGDGGAAAAIELGTEPTKFLSTVQIGITSIGILNGIVGESALAAPFAVWLQTVGLEQQTSEIGATALVVIVVTYFSIVAGELVPKRIAQLNPERIARLVARPMRALALLTRPFVHLLSLSTHFILRLMGHQDLGASLVTEEEIHALLEEGSEAGVIEKSEHQMVRNVFRLDERQIGSLMVPRADIQWLDVERPLEENLARIAASAHSRFPVCRGGLGDILGLISAKQIVHQTLSGGTIDIERGLTPPTYVPESLTGMELLDHFRVSHAQLAFVVDEYGEIQGLATLQDVLEAVTGEFESWDQDEAWAVQREDGSWLLDGMIPVPELKDRLELKSVPEEDKNHFHTLSGMMMWLLGRVPHTGDVSRWEQWRLEVVDLDGRRIDKVLASRIPESEPATESDNAPA
ncbi:MAG TPA: hemolysin family protein [Porticoccaceae bacterium]|nr:hemolysin family protein [Porticoccaceae bacterium]